MAKLRPYSFSHQVAIITGAASGIGLGLSRLLWQQGATVVLVDRDPSALKNALQSISNTEERLHVRVLDVTSEVAIQQLVEETYEHFGCIHMLFNNAGIGLAGDMKELTSQDWKKLIEVNLWGVIYGIHAVYPIMVRQGFGHIINTASGAGLTPKPGMTPYSAVKHAIVGLSTSLRAEACDYGVKVSAVCPGYIATNIMNSTQYKNIDPQRLKTKLERLPLKPTTPDKCAETILRGVLNNKAIITVTTLAAVDWWIYRLWPELSIQLNHLRGQALRGSR